jgi:uncharacterized protein YecE (DUF72 family)
MARLLVGTSGWAYGGWRGSFYPERLPASEFLAFYAREFDTAEVNYSFYRLPRAATYEKWYADTPSQFVFALKASRLITQIKRLREVEESWREFINRARPLKEKLGPILLQFPSNFHASDDSIDALRQFLKHSRGSQMNLRLALEFRHDSWFAAPVQALLREHDAALVIAHSSRYPVPEPASTGSFVYFRFHGPKELFASCYSDQELKQWAARIKHFLRIGLDAYAYFNNDARGDAVPNARTLREMVTRA